MKGFKNKSIHSIISAFCLAFSILFLLPTVLTVTNSFMSQSEIEFKYGTVFDSSDTTEENAELDFIPDMISLSQYITILFKSPDYLLKFWNSIILVLPIVIFQVAFAALAAYSFARYRGKHKDLILYMYIILMLMPYQVTLLPNYLVSKWLSILNTNWAIWLPGIFSPFSVFLLTKYMRRVPISYVEAAKLENASEWHIFRKIYLPLCKGPIYSVVILVFIDYWNMVEQPLILLSDSQQYPLSVYLSQINSSEIGIAFVAAVIYMIPPLLLFLHGEEHLIDGIKNSGGIKG